MKRLFVFFLLSSFIISSCAPANQPPAQIIAVYATSSAQFWLADVYSCADDLSIIVKMDADEPDIYFRLGETENMVLPAYQIGEEEIWVVANNAIQVESITKEEARELFTRGNPAVQIWTYASGEDIQRAFDQLALSESRVISSAKIASSVGQMSSALNSESNAIGILPKRALAGNVRAIFLVGTVPVLALVKQEPQESVAGLIACMQARF